MRKDSNPATPNQDLQPDLTDLHLCIENPAMMRDMFARARLDLRPRDWLETQLVDEICFARWRMLRLYVMEKATLDHTSLDEQFPAEQVLEPVASEPAAATCPFGDHYWIARSFTSADQNALFAALARLEARFHRQFMAAVRKLMQLRRSNPFHVDPAPRLDPNRGAIFNPLTQTFSRKETTPCL